MSLTRDIEEYVRSSLPKDHDSWCTRYSEKRKIIHDGIWGTFTLEPHEVALIDTPLIQRLRFIRQTGAVYLTYPSALHSRFEHTLGVLYNAGRVASVLRGRPGEKRIDEKDAMAVRFAALMHDTGHGPFSHTSEQFYSALPEFKKLREEEPMYGENGAGEILSSLMVLSKPFEDFVAALNAHFKQDINCEDVSRIHRSSAKDCLISREAQQ